MNLPNKLTITRIGLTMFFVMALLLPAEGIIFGHLPIRGKTIALAVFVVASLTDWYDGWLARRQKLVTNFGMLMDPLADKVLTTAAFICFIEQDGVGEAPLVQAWMVLLIVVRDFLVTGLRLVAREQGIVLQADALGKYKTASQMITITVVLLGLAAREEWHSLGLNPEQFSILFSRLVFWMMLGTVALTFVSGCSYLYRNRDEFLRRA